LWGHFCFILLAAAQSPTFYRPNNVVEPDFKDVLVPWLPDGTFSNQKSHFG
jgi:hypothetical protein